MFEVTDDARIVGYRPLIPPAILMEELPLTESVDLSIPVFGQSFLTGEPQRLMQGFIDRKR